MADIAFVGLNSRSSFEEIKPEISRMIQASERKLRSVFITCKALDSTDEDGNSHDFLLRFFCPRVGIDEDPVTGSSYTVSGPYWSKVLGKTSLYGNT